MANDNKDDIIIAMLEEQKNLCKNTKSPQVDLTKVDNLVERMEKDISATTELTEQLAETIKQVRQPVISERKFTIDIVAKEAMFLFIGMGLAISVLGSALYFSTRPNYDRIDNDLKYRYIKMKGEATPDRISELENLFEINRDNTKIHQMNKDVEDYERAVQEKATLDEQARLRQLEADKLNHEAEKLKKK
ncbi:MAG: hypothetical protein RR444_07600 [Oscillospiraceae bacterium]